MLAQVAVVMKGGSHRKQLNGSVSFESNNEMLNILTQFVDINHAESSVPSDRDRILSMIEASEGGKQSKLVPSFTCTGHHILTPHHITRHTLNIEHHEY